MTVTRFPHSNHIIHVGDPVTRFPTFHIRYGGACESLTVTRYPHSIEGRGPSVIDCYKVPTFQIRYGDTIRVNDSYKVPTFKSYFTCGGTPLQGFPHSI